MDKLQYMSESKKALKLRRKAAGLCIQCGVTPPFKMRGGKSYVRCKECVDYQSKIRVGRQEQGVKYSRQYRQAKRTLVFDAYGGKCACCGEQNREFLTVDHELNNGAMHRRQIGNGSYALYRWLIQHHYPSGFQLLCGNCHLSKNRSGICVHQAESLRRS